MTITIDTLRHRLFTREAVLASLRSRIKAISEAPPVDSSISAIQRRYLSAVAQLETRDTQISKPFIRASSDAVSSLANRWNKGIDGTKVQKTAVKVRGDVNSVRKSFAANDTPPNYSTSTRPSSLKSFPEAPSEILVEDGDGIPSWAKNQQKLFLRKENARSSVRDVDVKDLQGSVLENGARDGSEVERPKLELQGTVKARLAMWGKTVDEDALRLARRQEEEERKAEAERKAQLEREAAEKRKLIDAAIEKFANMTLSDVTKEPVKEIELVVYLERKIVLVNNEISRLETQLGDLQRSQ